MSKESPLFDRIRVKPDQDRRLRAEHPPCEWPGCNGAALHRAPKGRGRENEYWRFCLGATLARVEGQEVFRALAERFPGFRLDNEKLEYQPSITFRSLKSLPINWQ